MAKTPASHLKYSHHSDYGDNTSRDRVTRQLRQEEANRERQAEETRARAAADARSRIAQARNRR